MILRKQKSFFLRNNFFPVAAIALMAVISMGPSVCRAVMAAEANAAAGTCCEPIPSGANHAGANSSSEQTSCPLHDIGKVSFAPGVKPTLKDCPGAEVAVSFAPQRILFSNFNIATQGTSVPVPIAVFSLSILQNFRI